MHERTVSRLGWITLVVIMIVGASVIAGCMTNAPSGGSIPGPQGTQATITPTTPIAPTVTLNRPAPGSVKAVDFNLLIPVLPVAPAGWTAGDPEGMTIPEQDGAWTVAPAVIPEGRTSRRK